MAVGFGCVLLAESSLADDKSVDLERQAADLLQVIDAVHDRHIDPPARQEMVAGLCRELTGQTGLARKTSAATTDEQLRAIIANALQPESKRQFVDVALRQMLMTSRMPVFISPRDDHRVNQQVAENRYVGTGIQLRMRSDDHRPIMVKVFEGGPAHKVGAKDGDIIETIDDEPTEGLTIVDVIKKLRGPAGSTVEVTLRQPAAKTGRKYTIERGMVPIPTIENPVFAPDKTAAYVKPTSISASSVHELRKIASRLPSETKHVVLDFRDIENHNLHHGRLLANALINDRAIGFVVTADGEEIVSAEPGRLFNGVQLAVLINHMTKGTSEWIAAALQQHKAAQLMGRPTAGSGYVTEGVEVGDRVADVPVAFLRAPDLSSLLATTSRPPIELTPTTIARFNKKKARLSQCVTPDRVIPDTSNVQTLLGTLR